jgi:hypothetical protein
MSVLRVARLPDSVAAGALETADIDFSHVIHP